MEKEGGSIPLFLDERLFDNYIRAFDQYNAVQTSPSDEVLVNAYLELTICSDPKDEIHHEQTQLNSFKLRRPHATAAATRGYIRRRAEYIQIEIPIAAR